MWWYNDDITILSDGITRDVIEAIDISKCIYELDSQIMLSRKFSALCTKYGVCKMNFKNVGKESMEQLLILQIEIQLPMYIVFSR